MILRVLACLALALLVVPAQSAPSGQPSAEQAAEKQSKPGTSERSDTDYKAARERDDARHRLWDRKMKALTGSVCTGC